MKPLVVILALLLCLPGCASLAHKKAATTGSAPAAIDQATALHTALLDLSRTLKNTVVAQGDVHLRQSTSSNDSWPLRLIGLATVICGYFLGKTVWLFVAKMKNPKPR